MKRWFVMLHLEQPFFMALVAAVAVAAIGSAVVSPLLEFLNTAGARETAREMTATIGKELAFLTSSARGIAAAGSFAPYLRSENVLDLIRLMNDETSKRDIDLMMVADANGIVLARSRSVGERGDNIALTTAWGKAVVGGGTVAGVEPGRLHPLILLAGTPLARGGSEWALFLLCKI